MAPPGNIEIVLRNGWKASFIYRGEFKMGCDGWTLMLTHQAKLPITFFKDRMVAINTYTAEAAEQLIELAEDGRTGHLTEIEGEWIIDFYKSQIAPYRTSIKHNKDGRYVSVWEQPAFAGARAYFEISGKNYYVTFPFYDSAAMQEKWNWYCNQRRLQIGSLYFDA